jgi:hypothetical protein
MMDNQTLKDKTARLVAERAKVHEVEITLPVGASAEPDTCGSCKFFRRYLESRFDAMVGYCEIKMPPPKLWFKMKTSEEIGEQDWRPNRVKDTDACDFYRHDGRVYVVQRRIPAER